MQATPTPTDANAHFAVLLSGEVTVTERLTSQIHGARVIAADSGMRHAAALGVMPELWVGDFDSADARLIESWPDVRREPYPPAKNATDGEIAIETAIERGARRILLVGALGGERSDHAFAHMALAVKLKERGIDVTLTSGEEEGYPLPGAPLTFDLPKGSLFSVLAFADIARLTIEGARYPLHDFDCTFGTTRTISNVAEGPVTIRHTGGPALLLARPNDFSGA
ncbi:thiamine diphosphokinase [Georhizobium sp. MAB10]|jgi:thiamine pyrophosphokinase|uniref:thiamine diphosphokinase n=1 Tax=Georhizobium sp. MAB10 TaxID=3028319 RepID=UPI003855FDDB